MMITVLRAFFGWWGSVLFRLCVAWENVNFFFIALPGTKRRVLNAELRR
jgi:hypothetical protein